MSIVIKRGRPAGHRLSEITKEKIRQKRLGTSQTKETRDKISKSLRDYFKKKESLADTLEREYSYLSGEAADWVVKNKESIDETEYVMTEKRMSYLKQLEIALGGDIESLFGHNATPEFFILLKEEMLELKCARSDIEELYSLL